MKTFIRNRKNQKVVVVVEEHPNSQNLVFVMHGLGGTKEQPHVQTFAQAFRDNGFTVVLFDTTNSFGESDGDYADATTTNYLSDLEDVIAWAKTQPWYQEPFWLVGHSLGGISTALYTEDHPETVKALAPISTVVSGELSVQSHEKKYLEEWKRTGWLIKQSQTRPGLVKKLKWAEMEDRMKYDLLPKVDKLTMPVLMIVGDQDSALENQKVLYDKLPGKKELHIIKGAPHTFVDPDHLLEIKNIFDKWIKDCLLE